MTGKPAARIDDKVKYARIVTGSRTVLIGTQGGVACSVCPGGKAESKDNGKAVGNPVNPQLGAKVLSGASDLDFALPGAMPLVWQRQYSSYVNAEQGGYCGMLGYGWGVPMELRISMQASATLLHDSQGRTITFDALAPGESIYSASEDIWLLRSGMHAGGLSQELAAMTGAARFSAEAPHDTNAHANAKQFPGQAPLWWQGRFAWIGRDMACSDLLVFASTGNGDTVWVFAPANWQQIEAARAATQADAATDKAAKAKTAAVPSSAPEPEPDPDPNWVLLGKIDRLDRKQRYHWSTVLGQERITGIDDGVGRHYQLHYQQILPAQDAQHYRHKDGTQDSHFFWQADSGVRLTSIRLVRDPSATEHTESLPQALTLVHYSYSAQGDLLEVQDRHGQVTRRFAWRNHLMVFHQERSGPEHHYAYDRYEPGGQAIAQRNQEGLDYQFAYQILPEANGQPRRACVVTDSLGRVDTYIFQGEAGLARLVEHQRADGSTVQRSYNQFGHLTSVTDPLGRRVSMQVSPLGQLLSTQGPGGARSSQRFDDATGRLQSSTDAAGRTTRYAYDHYGRMTQVTLPDGSTEHYHYPDITDASGAQADLATRLNADKPHRITDAKGGDKHLTYTRTGQTASYTDCSGHSTRYAYNRWGQTLAVSNALAERVRYHYNAQDQLQAVQYPDGSTEHYAYDAQGQVVEVKAGRTGNEDRTNTSSSTIPQSTTAATVSMQYDLWGRLVQRSHAGQHLAFAYDAAGRLTQLTNENGEHTSFAWDAMDRLTQEAGFDARVQSYQYDAAGQLTESSDGWAAEQGLASHTSRYEWTLNGQLAARHLPASDLTPAATYRYEWGKTGELLQASVWQQRAGQGQVEGQTAQDPAGAILQSQALIERDAAGRVIGEVQRLYKAQATSQRSHPFAAPEIEFEHRISHKLDAMGNRLSSQLPGLGEVGYLLYGPGHVHGITWQGEALIDIERDVLHRETRRQLLTDIPHPAPGQSRKPLARQLGWDTAGRLTTMQWSGLEQGASLPDMLDSLPGGSVGSAANPHHIAHTARPPQALLGALTAKHYHYDSLGQMVGIQSPAGMSRFAYDAAGRLTGADTPHAGQQRWQFDPAGNRLPIAGPQSKPAPTEAITGELNKTDRLRAQQRASAQANPITQAQLLRPDFNPLQGSPQASSHQQGPTAQKWAGNRVAYYENSEDKSSQGAKTHYRYDSRGNRVQSLDETTGRQMDLYWDTGNQLVQVHVQEGGKHHLQHYRYDAFGRRLAKYNHPANSAASHESGTDYFGWDGDRLVHTERFNATNNQDNNGAAQPEIIHTIYEPGSFTPLIQLRRSTKAPPDLADQLLSNTQPGLVQDALRGVLSDIKAMNASMQHNIAIQAMPPDVQRFMYEQFQELEQTVTSQREEAAQSIEIRHYLCDHLGTPHALIREDTGVEWAVQLDAWGNVRVEHNPSGLYQPIRLPGQHADKDTGLYYNRYRYYESLLGNYLNQDPIRLAAGFNIYAYPINPISFYDSIGLQKVSIGRRNGGSQKASLLFDQTYPQVDLDIQTAKTISLPQYEIGGAANGKKPWQELSPYEYTQYCKKWSKNKLSCTENDREPGKDVKYPADYIPIGIWKSSELPQGYSCDSPHYFPEMQSAGSASTADFTDLADIGAKVLRNRAGARK